MKQFMSSGSFVPSLFVMSLLLVASGRIGVAFAQEKAASDINMQILRDKVNVDWDYQADAGK
jgi:hypothetical protein